jgi:hypothetical protein
MTTSISTRVKPRRRRRGAVQRPARDIPEAGLRKMEGKEKVVFFITGRSATLSTLRRVWIFASQVLAWFAFGS